jgi:hypothetical protein
VSRSLSSRPFLCAIGALVASALFFSSVAGALGNPTVLRAYYSVGVPSGGHVSRPTRIVFGADGRTYLDQLTWHKWGTPVARARGTFNSDGGPAGEPIITTDRALVIASHPARCDGHRTYLNLKAKIHHPNGKVTIWHPPPLASSWHHCRPLG